MKNTQLFDWNDTNYDKFDDELNIKERRSMNANFHKAYVSKSLV